MLSYYEPKFIEKFIFKLVFQILAKIKMMRNKNRLSGRHFEMVQHFIYSIFILQNHNFFYSAYIYGANFIAEFR